MDSNPFRQYDPSHNRSLDPLDWGLALSEGPLAERQKQVADILKKNGIKNILDYGAGFGAFILELLSNHPFANYLGVDADPEAFNQTSELAEQLTNRALKNPPQRGEQQGAQNIFAKLMRREYRKSRSAKILRAQSDNFPKDLNIDDHISLNLKYGISETPYSVSFLNATLPLENDQIIKDAYQNDPRNWAITAIGITENLSANELPQFFDGFRTTLNSLVAELVVMSYLDPQKQNTFGGTMQKTMAKIGPSIFNAKPPKLNAHEDFIGQCQNQLPDYVWESVASVGARCYALGRRIEDDQKINTNL